MSFDELKTSIVIIPEDIKKQILDLMYSIDYSLISKIRIKDVLARKISGWGHSINTERDVIYYSELTNLLPSLDLFRKNIRTVYNDTQGCYDDGDLPAVSEIRIDYTHLSPENKIVADNLIRNNNAELIDEYRYQGLSIFVRGNRDEEISVFNERMINLSRLSKLIPI